MVKQLRGASSSAPRLIAEGYGRYVPREFSRYLHNANGELKETIVCTPEDAFRCFMGTDLDLLVVGRAMLRKDQQDSARKQDYAGGFAPD